MAILSVLVRHVSYFSFKVEGYLKYIIITAYSFYNNGKRENEPRIIK